jgi:hypothetical protein
MVYQEVSRVEIKAVLRHWQAGGNQRAIARSTGLSRLTFRRYIPGLRLQAGTVW